MHLLEPYGKEKKTHENTVKPISFDAEKLDDFSELYFFIYIDLLKRK
jgi:hypothetical protein